MKPKNNGFSIFLLKIFKGQKLKNVSIHHTNFVKSIQYTVMFVVTTRLWRLKIPLLLFGL
jgi:hypothetical protein